MSSIKKFLHKTDKTLRLNGTIAYNLGLSIVSGAYSVGETLSGEIESSEELNVSRTAYREAIRTLAAKGLVSSKPKIGTRVNPRCRWHLLDPDVMVWTFEAGPDLKTLDNLYELRGMVEPAAAALACERRNDTHLRDMADALGRMKRYTLETEVGRQADVEFHTTLLQATDNAFIASLVDGIATSVVTTSIYKQRQHPHKQDPIPAHIAVFEAIADRDAGRAQTAMQHLLTMARSEFPVPPPKTKPTKFGSKGA